METNRQTITRTLGESRIDPESRDRIGEMLASVDLDIWFATVDDSPYPLGDWLMALGAFDGWLSGRNIEARPVATMLGYLECCTLSLPRTMPLPELSALLVKNLDQYGFDAAAGASSDETGSDRRDNRV